jgi:Spy/CpxP family protein refolding chaperone
MKKMTVTLAGLVIALASFGMSAFAQQSPAPNSTPNAQQRDGRMQRRRMMRRHERMRMFGALRQLNLSDAQKQQAQSLIRASRESTKTQRQELAQLRRKFRDGTLTDDEKAKAKELRQQLRASRERTRTQLASVLTPEQKTKLDEMIKNRRENRGRSGRRGQMNKPL